MIKIIKIAYMMVVFWVSQNIIYAQNNTFIHDFNISENSYESKAGFINLNDSGYIVCLGDSLINLDKFGDVYWSKSIGFQIGKRGIVNLNDSLFILQSENAVLLYNREGNLKWQKLFGGDTLLNSVLTVNNHIICNYLTAFNEMDLDTIRVLCMNQNQEIIWDKKYSTLFEYGSFVEGMTAISNGFVLHGTINEYFGLAHYANPFLVKFNELGDTIWLKYYTDQNLEQAYTVKEDKIGNLYFTGNVYTSNIRKVNDSGRTIWIKYPDYNKIISYFHFISDSNIMISLVSTEYNVKNIFLRKIDTSAIIFWERKYECDSLNIKRQRIFQTRLSMDGGSVLLGEKEFVSGDFQPFLMKVDELGNLNELTADIREIKDAKIKISIKHMNSGKFEIQLPEWPKSYTIYLINEMGQILQAKPLKNKSTVIDLSEKETGIYFLRVISRENSECFKIFLD